MKKKITKGLILFGIGALIIGLVAFYYHYNSIEEYTKRRLRAEYGEEFEIKTVYKDGFTTIAYPVNDPDLLFEAYYVRKNDAGFNHYLQAIVERQFKELIEEKLKDFEYKYYLDVTVYWRNLQYNKTDITIEKYDELTKGTPQYSPGYWLFLSCDALNMTDEQLYELMKSILYLHDASLGVFFLTDYDFDAILDDNYTLCSDALQYLDEVKKYRMIGIVSENDRQLNISFEEFKEIIMEVRNNGIYG